MKKKKSREIDGFDPQYWDAKAVEAFNKVNWDVMNKHLDSDDACKEYEVLKSEMRSHFGMLSYAGSFCTRPDLASIHNKYYSAPGSKNSTNGKSIGHKPHGMIMAKADFLKKTGKLVEPKFLSGFALGAVFVGAAGMWILTNAWSPRATNKKD